MNDVRYFYGAAHEQFPPGDLLEQAVAAEAAGFDGIELQRPLPALVGAGRVGARLGLARRRRAGDQAGPDRHRRHRRRSTATTRR